MKRVRINAATSSNKMSEDYELFPKKRHGVIIGIDDVFFGVYYSDRTWGAHINYMLCFNPGGVTYPDLKDYIKGEGGYAFKGITDPVKLPDYDIVLDLPSDPTVEEVKTAIKNSNKMWSDIEQLKTWLKHNSLTFKHNLEDHGEKPLVWTIDVIEF